MINLTSSLDSSQDKKVTKTQQKTYAYEIRETFLDISKRIDEVNLIHNKKQNQNTIEALKKFIPLDELVYEISSIDPHLLLQYIKQIAFYLSKYFTNFHNIIRVKMALEQQLLRQEDEEDQTNYEKLLQKLEGEVRQHIRIEQQQRLHIENQQAKIEELMMQMEESQEQQEEQNRIFQQRIQQLENELQQRCILFYNYFKLKENSVNPGKQSNLQLKCLKSDIDLGNLLSVQQANQSLQSSISQQQRNKSNSGHEKNDKTNNSINNNSKNSNVHLPLQLQALFNKVYTEKDHSQSQSKYYQIIEFNFNRSRRTISRKDNVSSKYLNENKQQPTDSNQKNDNSKVLKVSQVNHRHTNSINVVRNLEGQFAESDKMREELVKQFGQVQQYKIDAYLSHRDQNGDKNNRELENLRMAIIGKQNQKLNNSGKREQKGELSKSTSFDATSKTSRAQRPQKSSQKSLVIHQHVKRKTLY